MAHHPPMRYHTESQFTTAIAKSARQPLATPRYFVTFTPGGEATVGGADVFFKYFAIGIS